MQADIRLDSFRFAGVAEVIKNLKFRFGKGWLSTSFDFITPHSLIFLTTRHNSDVVCNAQPQR